MSYMRRQAYRERSQSKARAPTCTPERPELPVKLLYPVVIDVSVMQATLETTLLTDKKKMEAGWSPRELYVKSNPNLLLPDYTNPRHWYSSSARNGLLVNTQFRENTVKISDNCLPNVHGKGQRLGSKSAANLTSSKPLEYDKNIMNRGLSFNEGNTPSHKITLHNLLGMRFENNKETRRMVLGKDGTKKARKVNLIETKRDQKNKIALPPLNPDAGPLIYPHLPSHQPWASTKQTTTDQHKDMANVNRATSNIFLTEPTNLEELRLLDEETVYGDKLEKWFKDMPDEAKEDAIMTLKQLEMRSRLKNNPKEVHERASKGRKWRRHKLQADVPTPIPMLKQPVQYPSVFGQLRVAQKPKPADNSEINREQYKLKQKSELQLKLTEYTDKAEEEAGNISPIYEVICNPRNPNNTPIETTRPNAEENKSKKRKTWKKAKNKLPNRAVVRSQKVRFILARVPEDDLGGYSSDDEHSYTLSSDSYSQEEFSFAERNMAFEGRPQKITAPPKFKAEPKTAVVNLVMEKIGPPERKPYHIELSLQKMASTKDAVNEKEAPTHPTVQGADGSLFEAMDKPQLAHYLFGAAELHPSDNNSTAADIRIPEQIAAEKVSDIYTGTSNTVAISDVVEEKYGVPHADSMPHIKSVLSKYNKLEVFRDRSRPNLLEPQGERKEKPSCREWTRPPTYKLDKSQKRTIQGDDDA